MSFPLLWFSPLSRIRIIEESAFHRGAISYGTTPAIYLLICFSIIIRLSSRNKIRALGKTPLTINLSGMLQ